LPPPAACRAIGFADGGAPQAAAPRRGRTFLNYSAFQRISCCERKAGRRLGAVFNGKAAGAVCIDTVKIDKYGKKSE